MAIKFCGKPNCNSEFQDKMYGKNMRVYNLCKTPSAGTKHRCSKCLSEISSGDSKKK